ncbi:hypothetical protein JVT61DRAFT_2876 [Boletus reticuloceps]|uniref:Uncharacterized protein n=1 Tax=Boletus reticuloceps TaxID=495285 RepID=A0A8I3AA74_9AGAM|nr:hypothetical protein JVT61DRAFT_2876 [Boletus reticuloceps]
MIAPLSTALAEQTAKLISGFSVPPLNIDDGIKIVHAVKWQSDKESSISVSIFTYVVDKQGLTDICAVQELFSDMYDATEVLNNKKEMELHSIADIKKNDLVVLETKLLKYRTKDEHNKWTVQRMQMELVTIYLLNSADEHHQMPVVEPMHEINDLEI